MPLEKIYVTRHGFRSNWLVDPATGTYSAYIPSPTGIPADPALTSHGVKQARELGRHLLTLDPPIEALYSSPFYRCLETLEPFMHLWLQKHDGDDDDDDDDRTAGRHVSGSNVATKIRLEHGIQEWFGSAPFDHPRPAATGVLKALFPAVDEDYVSAVTPSPRGETLAQLQHRVAMALRAIIARCDADGTRALVLCSHAAVVIVLGRILTGEMPESIDAEDFRAFTCGLSVYRRESRGQGERGHDRGSPSAVSVETDTSLVGGWHCELNSDCSFLSGGEERGWRFLGDESFPGTGSLSQGDVDSKL